jgi:predicted Ser/Thr protein kinase
MLTPSPTPDTLFLSFQQTLAGRYSIDRELGRGGMGVVYLAREVHLDRLVAIKLLPPDRAADPSLRERFLREARLAAKLSHPNIIPIHAVEDAGGFVFYVMAFVDGETLAQRVRTRGPLPGSEGARVLREVAWALAYAHTQGLVHRDVKPDNILLESSTGRVLVADFGIAAALGEVSADGISGTPEFMSPEQALGAQIDARSDLYGLGATAFFAFSGRFPFEGKSATEVLAKQVTEPAPALGSMGMTVPRKLAAIVDRCLSKDPALRPASAQALAEELGLALEQRRELPAALRAFVKRSARLNGGGTLLAGLALLPASIIASAFFGKFAGFSVFALGGAAAPFGYLVAAARRLSLLGFAHQDLGPAFKSEMDQTREELAVHRWNQTSWMERWLPPTAKVSAVSLVASIGSEILLGSIPYGSRAFLGNSVIIWMAVSATATVVATVGSLAILEQRRDVDTEFWSNVWMGRIGKAAFSVARRLLGDRTRQSAMTHRATELSLGMAAEQLYESLPKETRAALGDLPAILRRLQQDAQRLRRGYDEIQEAVSGTASSAENADLREIRDSMRARLATTVGALETIRLNLLRLHAGSASVESVTTHLGLALEVSEEVERLIAAHQEVERSLEYPRVSEPTPV